jgi:hypothetical protein
MTKRQKTSNTFSFPVLSFNPGKKKPAPVMDWQKIHEDMATPMDIDK